MLIPSHGVIEPRIMNLPIDPHTIACRGVPELHRTLLRFSFLQFILKLQQIIIGFIERCIDGFQLLIKQVDHFAGFTLGSDGTASKIVPPLANRQLSFGLPFGSPRLKLAFLAFNLLFVRNGTCCPRAHLDKCVFHFLDDEAHNFFRVFGPVEHGVEVGVNNIA